MYWTLITYDNEIFRADKEKSKFQQEVYELLAQLDSVTKEKVMSIKTVEKLEVHVTELNVKIEELNRTIIDITNHKTRISQENIELTKEVQDLKVCDPCLFGLLMKSYFTVKLLSNSF